MKTTEKIIRYILETYRPDAVIVYGSFADGSASEHSDFDALVIADRAGTHDASVIDGTLLDVFVYPAETFKAAYDPAAFIQVLDGTVVLDKSGLAQQLQERVRSYVESLPPKSADEIRQEIRWCEKMLSRTLREDPEGYYRWHWLLTDSLEIYCDIKRVRYDGPKKALRRMEQTDGEAFCLYAKALQTFQRETLSAWISCLKRLASAL